MHFTDVYKRQILHDKKAAGDTINLIVPTAVGQCRICLLYTS